MTAIRSKTLPHAAVVNQKTCFKTDAATLNLNWAQSFVTLGERLAGNELGSISSTSEQVPFMLLATVTTVTTLLF